MTDVNQQSPLIRRAEPKDIDAIARVHVESWRSTYAGIVAPDVLASLSYEGRAQRWMEILFGADVTQFALVAEDRKSEVIGFANGGPERRGDPIYTGEISAIYLLERHQRKGIGRRLFTSAATELLERGFPAMLVWVLRENPACAFYEALGGKRIYEGEATIGGVKYPDLAYGWERISDFAIIQTPKS